MAKDNKGIKPKREMSRRQLASWQKQARQQRIILYISIGIVAAVLLIIGAGWFFTDYQPRHQKVLVINGRTFRMDYYISALKYYSGKDATRVGQIEPSIISYIQEGESIREGARQLGLSVADNETEAAMKDQGADEEYRDFVNVGLLAQKVIDNFKSEIPASAEQRRLNALLVESESKAQEVLKIIETSDNFTGAAEQFSADSYTRQLKGDTGFQLKEVLALGSYLGTNAVGDFAFSAPADNTTVSIVKDDAKVKNLGYWLIKVTDRQVVTDNATATADNTTTGDNQTPDARVKISAILLGSEDEAKSVQTRLSGGEDFAAVAKEVSQDTTSRDQGGDLGSFTKDTIRPAFAPFALDPAVTLNVVSDPVRDTATVTKGGYWLVRVLEVDPNRPVSDNDRDLLANTAYDKWYTPIRTNPDNKIDIIITEKQRAWAAETARKELTG